MIFNPQVLYRPFAFGVRPVPQANIAAAEKFTHRDTLEIRFGNQPPQFNSDVLKSDIANGSVYRVKKIIQTDAFNPNLPFSDGTTTPLIQSVISNQPEVMKALLAHPNLDLSQKNAIIPLALKLGHLNIILDLIKNSDVNLSEKYNKDNNLLHYMAKNGNVRLLEALTAHLAQENQSDALTSILNHRNQSGSTPIMIALKYGKDDFASALLEEASIEVMSTNREKETLYHLAAKTGCIKTIQVLVEKHPGLDINADNHQMETALVVASKNYKDDDHDTIQALLEHPDIDLNIKDSIGWDALSWCISNLRNIPVIEQILDRSDIEVTVDHILIAFAESHPSVIHKILEHKNLKPNQVNEKGNTALAELSDFLADSANEQADVLFKLIKKGAILGNSPDFIFNTPLRFYETKTYSDGETGPDLTRPKPEHVKDILLYRWMDSVANHSMTDESLKADYQKLKDAFGDSFPDEETFMNYPFVQEGYAKRNEEYMIRHQLDF
jgi:ankyrin repeat protein